MEDQVSFSSKLRVFRNFGGRLYLMVKHTNGVVKYAPLYIHSFKLPVTNSYSDAVRMNLWATEPSELTTIADKLRYYRYQKGLRQDELAGLAGLDRSTYISYENRSRVLYPLDKLVLLASIFEVDVTDLMDDYHLFLYRGQGEQVKALRKRKKLTQKALGKLCGVHGGTVKKWESGKVQMSKKVWERLFENGTT